MVLEPPVRWWHCPSCDLRDRTQKHGVHTQMHQCPARAGIALPLVEVRASDENARARHVAVEREDYIGGQVGAGPVAAILTERMDGSNDCTVLAPTAAMKIV